MSLNVPQEGDIGYGNTPPGSTYGPTTEKTIHFQKFLTLADQHPSLVTYEVVGRSSHPDQWDKVIFKIGNPNGGVVFWDCCIHGNEEMFTETMYVIMQWLLTPNTNTAQETRRQRILSKNLVIFFPFVLWRFSRMNYNYPANPCPATVGCPNRTDTNGDLQLWAINLARDFHRGHESSCISPSETDPKKISDNYAPLDEYITQYETQALVEAWSRYNERPTGWFYVNLHMGTTSKSGRGPRAPQVESLRSSVYTELFGGTKRWNISTSTDTPSFAPGEAVAYYDADGGWLIEGGGWTRPDKVNDFRSGTTYNEMLSLLVAQCELVEVSEPPPPTYPLTTESEPVSGIPYTRRKLE